jgi:protein SCO1/2
MYNKLLFTGFLISLLGILACQEKHELPYLGPKSVNASGDTVYHQIPAFRFLNQDSTWVTEKDMEGKI